MSRAGLITNKLRTTLIFYTGKTVMENVLPLGSFGSSTVSANHFMLAAGPLTKQPMSMPYRIVLIEYHNGKRRQMYNESSFSVHAEIFKQEDLVERIGNGGICDYSSFLHQGDYFDSHSFAAAVKRFGERVASDSVHVGSCYNRRDVS